MKQTKSFETVSIYGIPFSKMKMQETLAWMTDAIVNHRSTHVITANPIMVMAALENDNFMRVMQQADIIVPDGAGVVWAANKAGSPLPERVAGFDLLHELMRIGEKHHWKVFLLGAAPEVIQATEARLHELYPGVQIVGAWTDILVQRKMSKSLLRSVKQRRIFYLSLVGRTRKSHG